MFLIVLESILKLCGRWLKINQKPWFFRLPYGNEKVYIVLNVTIDMKTKNKKNKNKLSNVKTAELKESYRTVLFLFFSYPDRKIGLNDLSEELGIAKTTAKTLVLKLVDEGFLKKEEVGKAWRISCNNDHFYNKTLKITYNLELIFLSKIIQDIYRKIPGTKAIILFGSYRWGDDNENSDIDIAVETLDNQDLRIIEFGKFNQFGYRKNIPINLHVFSRNKINLNLFANISNGIILDGFLEVHP
ncbi:hypothetical protein GF386_01990 [Candidatus Pacearchaeota archaeon]|nr:hypothetical protein [Candidatus Pacearchaeota archaeon]MBD3282944.1 hypothetical protein [Candidatus Pacearchaeota archaeon]